MYLYLHAVSRVPHGFVPVHPVQWPNTEARPDGVDWVNDHPAFQAEQDNRPSKLVIYTMHSLNGIPKW